MSITELRTKLSRNASLAPCSIRDQGVLELSRLGKLFCIRFYGRMATAVPLGDLFGQFPLNMHAASRMAGSPVVYY